MPAYRGPQPGDKPLQAAPPPYTPPPTPGPQPVAPPVVPDKQTAGATPGTYSVNPLDPMGTVKQATVETQDMFGGLKAALFGTNQADPTGHHGGLFGIGDTPIGDLGRGASDLVAAPLGVVAGFGGHALDATGGLLEHLPSGTTPVPGQQEALAAAFEAIPKDSEAYKAAQEAMASDTGILGIKELNANAHVMSEAIRAWEEEDAKNHPHLFGGMVVMPGSAADTVQNLMGILGVGQRGVERLIAGAGRPGNEGMNQLQMAQAVARGEYAYTTGDKTGLSPIETIAVQKVNDGSWSETEALDFLASHGAGLSHDQLTEIAGTFATDPLNVAALGAGAIAKVGLTGVRLAEAVTKADQAVTLAREADAAATGLAKVDTAVKLVRAEEAALSARTMTIAEKGTVATRNLLGRAAETQRGTDLVKLLARPMVAIQDTSVGHAAKVIRTIVDPLHAMDLGLPNGARNVDLMSDVASKATAGAMGFGNHLEVLAAMKAVSPELYEQFTKNWAVYTANLTRRVVANHHRAQIMAAGLGRKLVNTVPGDLIDDFMKGQPHDILQSITEEAQRFRIRDWSPEAMDNLALRMEKMYGLHGADEWKPILESMNADQRSLLHASTYGAGQNLLVRARNLATSGTLIEKSRRFVLLNTGTLTQQGAAGMLKDVEEAATFEEKAAIIAAKQALYPELAGHVLDQHAGAKGIEDFADFVKGRMKHWPMQVTDDELKGMDPVFVKLHEDLKGVYDLGFAPEDQYKWGLDRVNKLGGKYEAVGDVWVDHVGYNESGAVFRAGRAMDTNIMGHALPTAVAKPLDYISVMGRTMKQSVSGTLISEAAHAKLMTTLTQDVVRGGHGMTKSEAGEISDAVRELAQKGTYSGPRGLDPSNMWQATAGLVPKRLTGKFTQRDLLMAILDAYEGDVRFVGLTQKLTGRAKTALSLGGNINYAGQIAEHLYPLVKFKMNALFQLQEKIEPWVLGAQRGVQVAIGTKMNAGDLIMQRSLDNMVNHSLVRLGDMSDQFEWSAQALHARNLTNTASREGSRLGAIKNFAGEFADVQGTKRLNMLRTFKKGLGKELKDSWESHSPGLWDEMKQEAQLRRGALINDDDFAVQVMGENLMGNDVVVRRMAALGKGDTLTADFKAAIQPGTWAAPQHIGELPDLELDNTAKLLSFTTKDGKLVQDEAELRAALAAKTLDMQDVKSGLLDHGAGADYVNRVENSLNFQFNGFMDTVTKRFNLKPEEAAALENWLGATAEMRGLSPADYLSQVLHSTVQAGKVEDAQMGSLGKVIDLMKGPDLAQLRSPVEKGSRMEFVGTREDLVNQLSSIFADHLDPSAKRALLLEFQPELAQRVLNGELKLDLNEVAQLSADPSFQSDLAQRMLGTLQHQPVGTVAELDARMGPQLLAKSVRNLPPDQLDEVARVVGQATADFPNVPLVEVVIGKTEGIAETKNFANGKTRIVLNRKFFGPKGDAAWAEQRMLDEAEWAVNGRPLQTSMTREGALRHEMGHAIDEHLRNLASQGDDEASRAKVAIQLMHMRNGDYVEAVNVKNQSLDAFKTSQQKAADEYRKFVEGMYGKNGGPGTSAYNLSKYAGDPLTPAQLAEGAKPGQEMVGELHDLAFGPPEELQAYLSRMRKAYRKAIDPTLDRAGWNQMVDDVEADIAKYRDMVEKTGLYVPDDSGANTARATQMFAKWTAGTIGHAIEGTAGGANEGLRGVLREMAGIPSDATTVPYDFTQGKLISTAMEAMARKWNDAFRLQYFKQSRTMLERSINHPMFGIYPASYMWGKLMPEVVKFIAKEPFGVKTGAMLQTMADVQRAVNVQREFDPDFDKLLEDLGHSQAMWFLGYLLPTVPWDVSAAWPAWVRELAQQGLDAESAVKQGSPAEQPDLTSVINKAGEVINPLRPVKMVENVAHEVGKFMAGPPAAPAPVNQGFTPQGAATDNPVPGTQLGPTLEEQQQQLLDILSR